MISSIAWVPAGVAAPVPRKYEMSATERELVHLLETKGNLNEVQAALTKKAGKERSCIKTSASGDLPADLRMDEYSSGEDDADDTGFAVNRDSDNESEGDDNIKRYNGDEGDSDSSDEDDLADVPDTREFMPVDVEGLEAMGLSQIGGVSGGAMYLNDGDDDASDTDDIKLTEDDAIVLVAKTEDDFASLEIHVYDQKTGNLYVHHDIPLPSFPLCLAHGQVSCESTTGNFCAIGTFSPGIEIWNLDILNALEPSCILGGEDTSAADEIMKLQMLGGASKTKFAKLQSKGLRSGSHTDAVMTLSWNSVHKQVIASGSADKTVKLWDVTKALGEDCNAATFSHHRDKVQSVSWHPKEGTLLATGSYDRTVALVDARTNGRDVKKVKIPSDCEAIAWDPFHPEYLTVASEDGTVTCWDVRRFETTTPAWSMLSNEFGGVSDISYNNHVPGMLALCSTDKTVTLWDTYNKSSQQQSPQAHTGAPISCGNKDMCSGKLYTVSFYPSDPWLLGCGGSGNQLALWDLSEEAAVQKRFAGQRVRESAAHALPEGKEGDFSAMMSTSDQASSSDGKTGSDRKKRKSKGKRNAHKSGR